MTSRLLSGQVLEGTNTPRAAGRIRAIWNPGVGRGQGVCLVLNEASNLVLYAANRSADDTPMAGAYMLWETGSKPGGHVVTMQRDGNLVMTRVDGSAAWASGTPGHPGAWLQVQDDGTLALVDSQGPYWAPGTAGFKRATGTPWYRGKQSGLAALAGDIVHAAEQVGHVAGGVVGKLTDNPIWNVIQTGASFIPGLGTAVSAGMASAAAIGRGESLKDLGLAAMKAALPAGLGHGIDIAIGAIQGHDLGPEHLRELRAQLPTAGLRGAFDAAVMIQTKGSPDAIARVASQQSEAARQVFHAALAAHRSGPAPIAAASNVRHMPGRSSVVNVPRTITPPMRDRPFPQITQSANRVATALLSNPELRSTPATTLARDQSVDTRDAQNAIAAFVNRFGATRELDFRDVGNFETFDQCARRHGVDCPELDQWPTDTGAMHVMRVPTVGVTRAQLRRIYARGDHNIKKAILAHELLAHVARNTGELEGSSWLIKGNGDWPSKVAQTVVGDGSRWKEILAVNPNLHLQANGNIPQWTPGTRVQLPPGWFPTAIVPVSAQPAASSSSSTPTSSTGGPPFVSQYPLGYPSGLYVVRPGDIGEKIAAMITGDKNRWRELLVTNPGNKSAQYGIAVYPGKALRLPNAWVRPQASPAAAAAGGQQPAPAASTAPAGGTKQHPADGPVSDGQPGAPAPKQDWAAPAVVIPLPDMVITGAAPASSQPIVTGSAEQIGTLQIMLAAFYRDHADAGGGLGAPFGSTPEDLAGVWTERTRIALQGFERWWNGRRNQPSLPTDGLPDPAAVTALMSQTDADGGGAKGGAAAAATSPSGTTKKKSSGGDDMIIPIGLLLAALGAF